jgi:hypothetical protein
LLALKVGQDTDAGGRKFKKNLKWNINLDTENQSQDNKELMAQWLPVWQAFCHVCGNEEVTGSIMISVNSFC